MNATNPTLRPCPDCQHPVSPRATACPNCGGPLWRKNVREAYSGSGLGVFDLLPGVRSLPYPMRLAVGLICTAAAVLLLVRWLVPLALSIR